MLVMGSGGTWGWSIPLGQTPDGFATTESSSPQTKDTSKKCTRKGGASRPQLVEPWRQLNLLQAKRPPQIQGLLYTGERMIARSNALHGKDPPTFGMPSDSLPPKTKRSASSPQAKGREMQMSFGKGSPSLWGLMLYYYGVAMALLWRQGLCWGWSPAPPGLVSTGEKLHPQCCVSIELLAGAVVPTTGSVNTSQH